MDEALKCRINRFIYHSPETGWAVASCVDEKTESAFTATGTIYAAGAGSRVSLYGEWTMREKYGRQFSVDTWLPEPPRTAQDMYDYLAGGAVCGIGPKTARRIVDMFGDKTFNVIENEPERLAEVYGIGEKKIKTISDSWVKQAGVRKITMLLLGLGVRDSLAGKIARTFGAESEKVVAEEPYRLAQEVWGIGFRTADELAGKLGFSKFCPERVDAGICYALSLYGNEGSCCAEKDGLTERAAEILGLPGSAVSEETDALIAKGKLVKERGRVFLPKYYRAERGIAYDLSRILAGKPRECARLPAGFPDAGAMRYDERQTAAIRGAVKEKVFYITGGPGTGKTTVTREIIGVFLDSGLKVVLAAPTGRAAKRLAEVSGCDALTIHRLLGADHRGGFAMDEKNRLAGDVLLVDECSMIDVTLMHALLKAVPSHMRVIFVGDADQLPSVGPGNVLRDIIASGRIPGETLTHIFRQAGGSRIAVNAARVNRGLPPETDNRADGDFFFAKVRDEESAAAVTLRYCSKSLPEFYGVDPLNDIQILAPMKKGPCGTENLNRLMQEALNPDGKDVGFGSGGFRVGDKVMQIRNDYEKNVYNGDVGIITSALEKSMYVSFDGGEPVWYGSDDLDELMLAYAVTIHKAQGSEYPIVVLPVVSSQYVMLYRNLLYTGITRARDVLVMVGDPRAVEIAARRDNNDVRQTLLEDRLRAGIAMGGGAA